MNAFLATVRAVYLLATIVIVGELAFRWWVEQSLLYWLPATATDGRLARRRRLGIMAAAVAAALIAGVLWFVAQVQVMSGMELGALRSDTLREALFGTGFGRVSLVRVVLACALGVMLMLRLDGSRRGRGSANAVAAMALLLLLSVALTGHANGEQGMERALHLCADMLHLLAAAAWLGGLPPLALLLFNARHDAGPSALALAARAARRFSTLGMAAVGMLCVSGAVNTWYTEGSFPALLGTGHGRLLSLKLLLFAAMLIFAALNRLRYTPRLPHTAFDPPSGTEHRALVRIGTHTICEFALGVAIMCILGALGGSVPGAHSRIVWPFRYTFSPDALRESLALAAACVIAVGVSIAFVLGLRRRRGPALAYTAVIAVWALTSLLSLTKVPAYPSTYFHSPVRYDAESIAEGARVYAAHCSACHGPQGRGDGPAAAALAERPADLTEHVLFHPEGEIWWWIKHGIPHTPMPAFGTQIAERDIWNLVNLLRARAEAEQAGDIGGAVQARGIDAPDFTFQTAENRQESLSEQRGRSSVLLVLFDPAKPPARLQFLAESERRLEQAGLRVIAIPSRDVFAAAPGWNSGDAIMGRPDRKVAAAYAILSGADFDRSDGSATKHAEFLIDKQGYVRARWTSGDGVLWPSEAVLRAQVSALEREDAALSPRKERNHVH